MEKIVAATASSIMIRATSRRIFVSPSRAMRQRISRILSSCPVDNKRAMALRSIAALFTHPTGFDIAVYVIYGLFNGANRHGIRVT